MQLTAKCRQENSECHAALEIKLAFADSRLQWSPNTKGNAMQVAQLSLQQTSKWKHVI